MGKILMLVLGLTIVGFIGYRVMYGPNASVAEGGQGTPKERLEGAKGAAKRIEETQNKEAEEALKKATSE